MNDYVLLAIVAPAFTAALLLILFGLAVIWHG